MPSGWRPALFVLAFAAGHAAVPGAGAEWQTRHETVCAQERVCTPRVVTEPRCQPYRDCQNVPQAQQHCTSRSVCRTVYDTHNLCNQVCNAVRQPNGSTIQNCQNLCRPSTTPRQVCTQVPDCRTVTTYRQVCQQRQRCDNYTRTETVCALEQRCRQVPRQVWVDPKNAPTNGPALRGNDQLLGRDQRLPSLGIPKVEQEGTVAATDQLLAPQTESVIEDKVLGLVREALFKQMLRDLGPVVLTHSMDGIKYTTKLTAERASTLWDLGEDLWHQAIHTGETIADYVKFKREEGEIRWAAREVEHSGDLFQKAEARRIDKMTELLAEGYTLEQLHTQSEYTHLKRNAERSFRRLTLAQELFDESYARVAKIYQATRKRGIVADGVMTTVISGPGLGPMVEELLDVGAASLAQSQRVKELLEFDR